MNGRDAQRRSARDHLAIALDLDDLDRAVGMARRVAPWFAVAKIGLELWATAGPHAVGRLRDEGLGVFCDLKLYDIPTTVGRASRVIGRLGASYVTLHAAGGEAMLRAGAEGLAGGAADAGVDAPCALGVTVLTSEPDASQFAPRVAVAMAAGCGGVVCSAQEVRHVKSQHPGAVAVVPGVRPKGSDVDDQARVGTPGEVTRSGGDILVVGRAVTAAGDPVSAARRIHDEVVAAIADRRQDRGDGARSDAAGHSG